MPPLSDEDVRRHVMEGWQRMKHKGAETIIASGTEIRGTLYYAGPVRVSGCVLGDLAPRTSGAMERRHPVSVACSGKISGRVLAEDLYVSGLVEGDVSCTRSVTVAKSGELGGAIQTPGLTVCHGAVVKDRLMRDAAKVKQQSWFQRNLTASGGALKKT